MNDPSYTKKSYKGKMELLNKIRESPKFKLIAKLAGRYKAIAMQRQRMKVKKGVSEIYSVKQGSDIERLLPSELMKLNDPDREPLFFKDLFEGKTLQYETRTKGKEVKGPILVLLDESSSMSGSAENWSKAVALGLMEIARNQKRDFGMIHFSGDHQPENLRVDYFLKNDPYDIYKIIDAVEYFTHGGTNFEAPLKRAQQIIDKHEAFSKADITFITDGESAVGEKFLKQFNKWKEEKKVSVFSILIDTGGSSSTVTLKEFTKPADIFKLRDLKDDSADAMAIQIFDQI